MIIMLGMVNFAFLDSGTGGLPYLTYLKKKNPSASCIYIGDTKHFPYGEKTEAQIIENACGCVEKIIARWNPHTVVIACNTISVTALEELRRRFPDTPFVGTVPAIKPAGLISKTRRIGLLATNATVRHPYTAGLCSRFAPDCRLVSRGDPELISFIEHRFFSATESERIAAVRPAVDFFRENGCDVIVLACTHFLNMADYIQAYAGSAIQVIDSREGVASHALSVEKTGAGKTPCELEESALYVTGFSVSNDSCEYETFCRRNNIKFGGILQ